MPSTPPGAVMRPVLGLTVTALSCVETKLTDFVSVVRLLVDLSKIENSLLSVFATCATFESVFVVYDGDTHLPSERKNFVVYVCAPVTASPFGTIPSLVADTFGSGFLVALIFPCEFCEMVSIKFNEVSVVDADGSVKVKSATVIFLFSSVTTARDAVLSAPSFVILPCVCAVGVRASLSLESLPAAAVPAAVPYLTAKVVPVNVKPVPAL